MGHLGGKGNKDKAGWCPLFAPASGLELRVEGAEGRSVYQAELYRKQNF